MTDVVRRFEAAAVRLAAAGYFVFPCKSRRKEPLTPRGFHDATREEKQILRWWDRWPGANIGIALGASGLLVLDIDSKHGADPREWLPTLGLDTGYPVVWTGEAPPPDDEHPNSLEGVRGCHVYFQGRRATVKLRIPGTETYALDLRGDGSYVLAPPSVHPSGVPYELA
jgi:hypothetical protein